ncbi:MAG: hypothetical protein ACOC44_18870 [Promethearchaeia archaeon]
MNNVKLNKKELAESDLLKDYFVIFQSNNNAGKKGDISDLNSKQMEKLYKIFVSKEINDKIAVKWRFYQYLKYSRDLEVKSILINYDIKNEIDFIVKASKGRMYFISCQSTIKSKDYQNLLEKMLEFSENEDLVPDKFILATNKTYRTIDLKDTLEIGEKNVDTEVWVEWFDVDKKFNGDDLLIINDKDYMTVAGFNFTQMKDFLDYVYTFTRGGQMSLYRQPGFFSEQDHSKNKLILIWKGIMIK